MRLTDSITYQIGSTGEQHEIRCHVGEAATYLEQVSYVYRVRRRLTVFCQWLPPDNEGVADRIIYRGVSYFLTLPPTPHVMRGKLHHYTIQIQANAPD